LSAAHIQAVMLEQAAVEPGMRVLEVGSGGYNAALLQELVGPGWKVVSVDIDPQIAERAPGCLSAAGYERDEMVRADAENGIPGSAPYDRIVVTAGAWDIPPAWLRQLSAGGMIVVPLRMKGLTRAITFDRTDAGLESAGYRLCGFVPMQRDGAGTERRIPLGDGLALWAEGDFDALRKAASPPALECWSGAAFDLPDELELFLMTSSPQVALLRASRALVERGLSTPLRCGVCRLWPPGTASRTGSSGRTMRPEASRAGYSPTGRTQRASRTGTSNCCAGGRAPAGGAEQPASGTSPRPAPGPARLRRRGASPSGMESSRSPGRSRRP
jgi:protein-L-isoaspartate(D-aspartate) O-methyltransferase